MMRWLLVMALVAFPALGAEIVFEQPPSLAGTFHVVVRGVAETAGHTTLINLRTGETLTIELRSHDGALRTGPIYARRACDEPRAEAMIMVQLGDTLVAATALGGGLSVTARVGPRERRPGEPTLSFQRWDDLAMEWVPAKEVVPARYRIVLADAAADTTCERDSLPLPMEVGTKAFDLALSEDAATSGRFSGEFVMVVAPRACDLVIRVLSLDEKVLLEVPMSRIGVRMSEASLACRRGEATLRAPFPVLPVTLVPSHLLLPVGCVGGIRVVEPDRVDEVRWCVEGAEQAVRGPMLTLYADAPRPAKVVALVRQGLLWGRAEATVAFVPQVKLSLVDAETGFPVTEPWPCTQPVQIRAEHVVGAAPVVLVGKLGPDPRTVEIALAATADKGVFLSRALRASDFAACAGDVLWVQLKDPRGCYSAYVTLSLR